MSLVPVSFTIITINIFFLNKFLKEPFIDAFKGNLVFFIMYS